MKLKKLVIHNIASIVDATIDFEAPALAKESLFLICGDTGAGKTTILDCICLALFGTTPRINMSAEEKFTSDTGHAVDNLNASDVRQLMRRGTTEAEVVLDFEGNDGVSYTAQWEVHRAHNKPEGKLQDAPPSLTNNRTGEVMTKKKEIDNAIAQAVQLNADQFTRTVILPQGQFSQFMRSKADEKSSLLEKLTGVDQYTVIGKRIFDIYNEKKHEWEREYDKMEGIKLMSEEEIQEKKDNIDLLKQQEKEASSLQKTASEKLSWIANVNKAKEDKQKAEAELSQCVEQAATPQAQAETLLIKQWDETAQMRTWIQDLSTEERELQQLQSLATEHRSRLVALCRALVWHEQELDHHQRECDLIRDYLKREEPNSQMYGNKLSIIKQVNAFKKKGHDLQEALDGLSKDKAKLPAANQAVKNAEADLQTALEAYNEAKRHADELEEKVEQLNLSALHQRMNHLLEQQKKLVQAENALTMMKTQNITVCEAEKEYKSKLQTFEQAQEEEPKAEAEVRRTQEKADEAAKRLAKAELRVKDWVKEARAMLTQGDECPLCGHVIDHALGDAQADSLLEDVRQEKTVADENLIKAKASLQTAKNNTHTAKDACDKAQQSLTLLKNKAKEGENAAHEAILACSIEVPIAEAPQKIQQMGKSINDELKPLKETITNGEQLETSLKDARKRKDEKNGLLNNAKETLQKKREESTLIENAISTQSQLLQALETEQQNIATDLNSLVTHQQWQNEWSAQPEDFMLWLEKQATEFAEKSTRLPIVERTIVKQQSELDSMRNCRNLVETILPPTGEIDSSPSQTDDASKKWEDFKTKVVKWNEQIVQTTKSISEKNQQIDQQIVTLGMERTRVNELAQMQQSHIQAIRTAHEEREKRQQQLKGAISTLNAQLSQLRIDGEKLIAEDNVDTLNAQVDSNKQLAEKISRQIGAEQALLEENTKKGKELSDTIKKVEQYHATMMQWEALSKMLGDGTGKTFRKIAQSFILGDLINRANIYLRQFSDRLVLSHEPGTLTLLVRDIMQGQQPLSTSTLSGGESFMVSLSLALALAQMNGNAFSVDTLFIDEGFGTLSSDFLETVMETLERLHALGGRRVGIISHVKDLRDSIKTQICVERDLNDSTRSNVVVRTP